MRTALFALLLLLTFVANTAWTQPYKKQYSFSNATSINNFSTPYSLIQTLDGGFAFTITSRSSWLTQNGFTLTKTTDDGTVEWAIEYDTLMYDDYPVAFLQLSDSSYYVITAANQYARFHTWRIGPGGALIQARTYLPLTPPNAFFPEAMCLDQGEQPVFAVNKSSQSSLMKTDLTGNVLWAKKYLPANISATSSKITLVKTASDGGFLAGGNVYVDDTSILNADSSFLQVFKTDSTGQPLWSLHILLNITSSTSTIRVNSITETSTGDLLFAGSTDGTIQKGFILKTSSSGSYKWLKVFNNTNRIGSIYELPNGNYRFTALQYDPLVTNLDSAGNTLQCYFLDVNSPVSKYAVSVIPTNNQSLALLCASNFSLKHLIITDSNLQSGCYQQQTICPTTSSFNYLINTNTITATSDFIIGFDITSFCTTYPAVVTVTPDCPTGLFHSPSEGNINFSPNPFTDHITVSSGLPDGRFLMRINDAAGRLVFQQWVIGNGTGLIEADLSFLTNGVYALTLTGEQSSGTVRILKM